MCWACALQMIPTFFFVSFSSFLSLAQASFPLGVVKNDAFSTIFKLCSNGLTNYFQGNHFLESPVIILNTV